METIQIKMTSIFFPSQADKHVSLPVILAWRRCVLRPPVYPGCEWCLKTPGYYCHKGDQKIKQSAIFRQDKLNFYGDHQINFYKFPTICAGNFCEKQKHFFLQKFLLLSKADILLSSR